MPTITTKDGTQIYYKDWGSGPPVVFSHGWPLSADAWEDQMLFLAAHGYRSIAHDCRGHGRSSQPWNGNDMDTHADDLAALVEALGLATAILVGHSTGGGEVARYIGRHGTKRVAKAVLIGAVPPLILKTPANPGGLPIEVFDGIRAGVLTDCSQFFKDLSMPFYGYNRPGAQVSQGVRDSFWLQGMQCGLNAAYDCIKAFSETDHTEEFKKFDVPTLIIHGNDDQIVPIGASALLSSKIVKGATLKVCPGALKDQLNAVHAVCVAFPALDALAEGFKVYAVMDASGDPSEFTSRITLARFTQAGVIPTSTNAVVCEFQRHWNRPNNEEFAKLYTMFAPNYGAAIESFQKAQEVFKQKQ